MFSISFVNLEPAFDGAHGWLTVSELYSLNNYPTRTNRFAYDREYVAHDGTIFVYAFPATEETSLNA